MNDQTDSIPESEIMHCIPLNESRWLHEDAVKEHYYESLTDSLEDKVAVLWDAKSKGDVQFNELMAAEKAKTAAAEDRASREEALKVTYIKEAAYWKRMDRRHKRQRNWIGGLAGAALILAAIF